MMDPEELQAKETDPFDEIDIEPFTDNPTFYDAAVAFASSRKEEGITLYLPSLFKSWNAIPV